MLESTAPLPVLLIALSFEEEDDDGAIPRAASVTALKFSISSLAIGGRCSFTGLALNVRATRFAVVVFIVVAVFARSERLEKYQLGKDDSDVKDSSMPSLQHAAMTVHARNAQYKAMLRS